MWLLAELNQNHDDDCSVGPSVPILWHFLYSHELYLQVSINFNEDLGDGNKVPIVLDDIRHPPRQHRDNGPPNVKDYRQPRLWDEFLRTSDQNAPMRSAIECPSDP
ncbi:hypothetical protein J6590_074236 [Homalodisca vitripennis]|nr:hypothetical protein J6590_074236 [Homalodisca vitripennis]